MTTPHELTNQTTKREAEREGIQHQDDPGAGPEVGLDDPTGPIQPAKAGVDKEEHAHHEQPDQGRGDLGHVEEEIVRDLPHGRSLLSAAPDRRSAPG
jgi:hypothetical protein